MATRNDIDLVTRVMTFLESQKVQTWLFGGWAEELNGMVSPRDHRDIDLLYLARDFNAFDQLCQEGNIEEIGDKHLAHKRAFVFEGIMVELFLVQPDLVTKFWDRTQFRWPQDTFDGVVSGLRVASVNALIGYRRKHPDIHG